MQLQTWPLVTVYAEKEVCRQSLNDCISDI